MNGWTLVDGGILPPPTFAPTFPPPPPTPPRTAPIPLTLLFPCDTNALLTLTGAPLYFVLQHSRWLTPHLFPIYLIYLPHWPLLPLPRPLATLPVATFT